MLFSVKEPAGRNNDGHHSKLKATIAWHSLQQMFSITTYLHTSWETSYIIIFHQKGIDMVFKFFITKTTYYNFRTLAYLWRTVQTVPNSKFDSRQQVNKLISNEIAETQKKGWIKNQLNKATKASDTNSLTLSNSKFNDFKGTLLLRLFMLKMKRVLVKMYFNKPLLGYLSPAVLEGPFTASTC